MANSTTMSDGSHKEATDKPAVKERQTTDARSAPDAKACVIGNLQMLAARGANPVHSGDPYGNQTLQHEAARAGTRGSGAQLPYLDQIQRSFGKHDVQQVRAHIGGDAAVAADDMGANAFATGNHVAFRGTPGLATAAHEAAHVVQQRGGVQLLGGVGRAGDRYEQHADRVAERVVAGESSEALLDEHAGGSSTPSVQHECTCPPGECECSALQKEDKPGLLPDAPTAAPAQATADAKTFANGYTFSSDAAFTRKQLIAMWVATDRETTAKFVATCDQGDVDAQQFTQQLNWGHTGWDDQHPGTPPPATAVNPVYSKPPMSPAEMKKSGLDKRLAIYRTIREEFATLDGNRTTFVSEFQSTAKTRLAFMMEASKKGVELEMARYGIDVDGEKSGKSNTADVQKDLAEMAVHAAKLARLKRELNQEFADEMLNALPGPGLFSMAWGTGSGAKFPTTNGPSGIGNRLRIQRAYDEECAFAFKKWPVLGGMDPSKIGQAPTAWESLAAGATPGKPGTDQTAVLKKDAETKLANIQEVKDHIGNGDLIWDIGVIVSGTQMVMGIGPGSIQRKWLDEHEHKLKEDKETLDRIVLAVTLALVVITLIPSGGSSALAFASAAASVGLAGISTYQAIHEIQEYSLKSAEHNTTYDKALAISSEEPSLMPVALAIVAAGLDIHGALTAFRSVRGLYRAALLKEEGALGKLEKAVEGFDPQTGKALADRLVQSGEAVGEVAVKREAMEANKLGDMMKVAGGHEGVFSKAGKLFRCSPVCGMVRDTYDAILRERPDLMAWLNRLEDGAIDVATVEARRPQAQLLLDRLQSIQKIRGMEDAELKTLLRALDKSSLTGEMGQEAVRRFGSVEKALKDTPELIGKAAEAPAMKALDPGALMAPENFKAYDAVNLTAGKGATVTSSIGEEVVKGQKVWVVEQRISGGKWYSIKTLKVGEATEKYVASNVKEALSKALDEATGKAASIRDPSPIYGKDVYLRVIKDGPADSIEIVIQIPVKNSGSPAEIKQALSWAEAAKSEWELAWSAHGKLPPTTVTVLPKP